MSGPSNPISSGDNASPIYTQKGPGIQTLETLEEAHNCNSWIASLIQPHLGTNNIENHCEIIAHAGKILTHGGKFVALVPAHELLYSKMDQALGQPQRCRI